MATLKEKFEALQAKYAELEKTNQELVAVNSDLLEGLEQGADEALKAQISELQSENVELNKRLALADKNKGETNPVFEYEGEDYQFTVPAAIVGGKKIVATEVAESPAAYATQLKALIDMKSPLLKVVDDAKEEA